MNRNRKKAAAATLAAGMAVVLGAGTVMAAASTGDNGLQKEETVYVNTTAGGEVTDVTVSDWLKNSGDSSNSEVKDASDLQDIKNVKGDETFTQNGNDLTWSTDGKDIYYQGKEVVFVASIVIGCIQLGATVDYAILMTSRYQKERGLGKSKKESIAIAHKTSMKSIVISGCSFFAATFGVGLYTQVDMIGSITNLLSRGAVISTLVVLFILPAMFMIFDSLICHTSIGFAKKKPAKEKKQ